MYECSQVLQWHKQRQLDAQWAGSRRRRDREREGGGGKELTMDIAICHNLQSHLNQLTQMILLFHNQAPVRGSFQLWTWCSLQRYLRNRDVLSQKDNENSNWPKLFFSSLSFLFFSLSRLNPNFFRPTNEAQFAANPQMTQFVSLTQHAKTPQPRPNRTEPEQSRLNPKKWIKVFLGEIRIYILWLIASGA